jgi:DNA replicative helicase MCM subunit Mcm2 (Cdc46/Mcm family)
MTAAQRRSLGGAKKRIYARVYNFEGVLSYQEIKSDKIKAHVSIRGVVMKQSSVKLFVHQLRFACVECERKQTVRFE